MPSSWAGVEEKSAVGPGPKPRLQPYDVMAPSVEDLAKIKALIQERESLPVGSRKRQLAIARDIWHLRHPGFKPDKAKRRAANQKWVRNNPEKRKQVALGWYYRNRPTPKQRVLAQTPNAIYQRGRRVKSIQMMLAGRLRATLNRAFRRAWIKKSCKSEDLLGCTIEHAKNHIERQFKPGMSWSNRSSFVIDHWIPVTAFDMNDTEEVQYAFGWQNLRPLTRHDNAVKQGSIPETFPPWLPTHIAERITLRSTLLKRRQH